MSAIVAAEVMHRLPRLQSYGVYPDNTHFGDFDVSYDRNLGELVARDAFLYAGSTSAVPPVPAALQRIAGYGSSSTVTYGGDGIYFLDKVRPGVWRLEVYPDAEPVADPFEPPNADKIVTRAISRTWPMTVMLPDLGPTFTVQPVTASTRQNRKAIGGQFTVEPGVFVLAANGPVDAAALPAYIGHLGFAEYHAPPPDSLPVSVQTLAAGSYPAGHDAELHARIVARTSPDSVTLFVRSAGRGNYRGTAMHPVNGYDFAATLPAAAMQEGPHEYVITVFEGSAATTFPGGLHLRPSDWGYYGSTSWPLDVTGQRTPLRLFSAKADAARLVFTRIGDAGRAGLFGVPFSGVTGEPVLHFELPVDSRGWSPDDYTASLVIKDRVGARQEALVDADSVHIRLRGVGPVQTVHLTLMEDDGTSWSAAVSVDGTWREQSLPLGSFVKSRGVLLPEGFPGEWNYWVGPAAERTASAERLRLAHVERLQLSLRRGDSGAGAPGRPGVEVEWVTLGFGRPPR
jgi:hypothetical protein